MSKKTLDIPEITHDHAGWSTLLQETAQEILASPDLTADEKERLQLPRHLDNDEPPLGACSGRPISETIIEDRGER